MSIKRRVSVCVVVAAFSIANALALVAESAAEAIGSFNLPGNTKVRSAKILTLLLGCSSALAVSLLRTLVPELRPLLEAPANRHQ
jgi:hypothetical protein